MIKKLFPYIFKHNKDTHELLLYIADVETKMNEIIDKFNAYENMIYDVSSPIRLECGKVYEDRESNAWLIIKNDGPRLRGVCLSTIRIGDFIGKGHFISEDAPHKWDLIKLSSDQRPYRV